MAATNFIWDFATDSYLMEKNDSGSTTAVYTNEPVQYGKVISQRRGSTTNYYHFDSQGSTRQLTDQSATTTDAYSYSAYGDEPSRSGSTENPFQYVGRRGYYFDSSNAAYYVRSRRYDPTIGRWTSIDPLALGSVPFPLGSRTSWNWYRYAEGNPMLALDPSGLAVDCRYSIEGFLACWCISLYWPIFRGGCRPYFLQRDAEYAQRRALEEARARYPDDRDLRNVALRHCFASGILAALTNCHCAYCIGSYREEYQEACSGQLPRETRRGERNNGHGRRCAGCTDGPYNNGDTGSATATEAEVIDCCLRKLNRGELDTTDAPDRPPD